jgi:hypothetical protein
LERRFQEAAAMIPKTRVKLIREGEWVAEVEVERIDEPKGWEPYLSLEDAEKLERVRAALKPGDARTASKIARSFRLTPMPAT